jgi:hypothetical protein
VERCRRQEAEHRAFTGAEGRGVPAGLAGEVAVADGIDAGVDAMQAAAFDASRDLTVDEARAEELDERY